MEEPASGERKNTRPSTLSVLLGTVVVAVALVQAVCLVVDGAFFAAGWLLGCVLLLLIALRVLRLRRDALFAWPWWCRGLATLVGLGGAVGMFIQGINFGVAATYFPEASFWAEPFAITCMVMTIFLPAVVMHIWLAGRD